MQATPPPPPTDKFGPPSSRRLGNRPTTADISPNAESTPTSTTPHLRRDQVSVCIHFLFSFHRVLSAQCESALAGKGSGGRHLESVCLSVALSLCLLSKRHLFCCAVVRVPRRSSDYDATAAAAATEEALAPSSNLSGQKWNVRDWIWVSVAALLAAFCSSGILSNNGLLIILFFFYDFLGTCLPGR